MSPSDVEESAEAMTRPLSNEGLKRELRERGLRRAALFTREKTARETLQVYKAAASTR